MMVFSLSIKVSTLQSGNLILTVDDSEVQVIRGVYAFTELDYILDYDILHHRFFVVVTV